MCRGARDRTGAPQCCARDGGRPPAPGSRPSPRSRARVAERDWHRVAVGDYEASLAASTTRPGPVEARAVHALDPVRDVEADRRRATLAPASPPCRPRAGTMSYAARAAAAAGGGWRSAHVQRPAFRRARAAPHRKERPLDDQRRNLRALRLVNVEEADRTSAPARTPRASIRAYDVRDRRARRPP